MNGPIRAASSHPSYRPSSATKAANDAPSARHPWGRRAAALLLLAIGAILTAGGVWLLLLGGSPYYLAAGLCCVGVAAGTWRGARWAGPLYATFLLASLVWAWLEAGIDFWALLARLGGPAVVGLLLAVVLGGWGRVALLIAVGIVIAVGGAALASGGPELKLADDGAAPATTGPASAEWLHYGNDQAGRRFSPLADIRPDNVAGLREIWRYRLGAPPPGPPHSLEVTPLQADGNLYLCSGYNDVVALDAATGRERWRFRAKVRPGGVVVMTCRGLARFAEPVASGPCAARIITATVDARLIALDARTGRPCMGFGQNGAVDLTAGLGEVPKGYYYVTSPPAIVRGRIVLGGWVTDGQSTGEPSGVIRAFDARTGALAWAWDMGRPDRQGAPPPGEQYTRGTPNSWAPISADEALGLVYLPTGNATPDYFGAHRSPASEKYSSSVIALDAQTGRLRWSFQTTHHDIWDWDVASQPTLLDLPAGGGQTVPALLQATKRGQLFLLDRRTGKPLSRVVERPVSTDAVPEERPSPTQPFSVDLPDFAGPELSERRMWGLTPLDQLWCRIRFRQARYHGQATPVTLRWTIVNPGFLGGMNWGSLSFDPRNGVAIVNANRFAMIERLMTRAEANARGLYPARSGVNHFAGGALPQAGVPYAIDVSPFVSPLGVPCQQPPFATIAAVDIASGRLRWSRPLGTSAGSGPFGLRTGLPIPMGPPSLGGAITTAGGLTFVGASQDERLRAFATASGRELWSAPLPAGGQATPMTYKLPGGRQVVLIAAGGNGALRTRMGDYIVAFALP